MVGVKYAQLLYPVYLNLEYFNIQKKGTRILAHTPLVVVLIHFKGIIF
jgi:hypothetical protein